MVAIERASGGRQRAVARGVPLCVALHVLGCSVLNDSEQFVILPGMAGGAGAAGAPGAGSGGENAGECWREGVAGRCDGDVPLRCAPTGEWLPARPACPLGCTEGACLECDPEMGGSCGEAEGVRFQCSASGRWLEAMPCGLTTPHCSEGSCLACGPNQRTCIDGVPRVCGPDGQWLAQAPCADGRACDPATGACASCGAGEVRGCANEELQGNCGDGFRTCLPSGAWSECSVAVAEDSCEIEGDDGNCDGIPNSPSTPCSVGCSAAVPCGPAIETGICARGVSACVGGQSQACVGAIYPAPRDCTSMEDNDCNGTPDALDESCTCAPGAAPRPCESAGGDVGICQAGTQVCVLAPGGTATAWSACQGQVAPRTRQCDSAADNDCDGAADEDSAACECLAGSLEICTVGGCQGLRRCIRSEGGDATYWSECELEADWTFVNPERLTGLGVSGDSWGPAPFEQGRYIAFSADAIENVYVAERVAGATYGQAMAVTGVNGPSADGTPFVTLDGSTLYFDSRRDGEDRDLWRAGGGGHAWADPEPLDSVNGDADDLNPWLSPDERLLVFTSSRTGNLDLWAAVSDGHRFGEPQNLVELNTAASDEGAVLTRDGLTVFFASSRPGGLGRSDVWFATRSSLDAPFGMPRNLTLINSEWDELDPAASADGGELFFSSNRGDRYELYRATRGCE